MKILVIGGTGAMGQPLVDELNGKGYSVCVTSRQLHEDRQNIHYITGNAKEDIFIQKELANHYDIIVDFLSYSPDEFSRRIDLLLNSTGHYFFLSSSRVYADSENRIKENSPRLLDISKDKEYLQSNEYAIAKAREEDMIFDSGKQNWTIIRPYITYNDYRLQLGVYEKENWLFRALNKKSIVLPLDIAEKTTTLTWGGDVANVISKLIEHPFSKGEVFHVTGNETITWKKVLDTYVKGLQQICDISPKVVFLNNSNTLETIWNKYQIKYDRLYNRSFDNSKLLSVIGDYNFMPIEHGLLNCLKNFINHPNWKAINYNFEIWADVESKDKTRLRNLPGKRMKIKYLYRKAVGYK